MAGLFSSGLSHAPERPCPTSPRRGETAPPYHGGRADLLRSLIIQCQISGGITRTVRFVPSLRNVPRSPGEQGVARCLSGGGHAPESEARAAQSGEQARKSGEQMAATVEQTAATPEQSAATLE